jgi:hypothetical protein
MKLITLLFGVIACSVSATTLTINKSSDWRSLPEAQQQAARTAYGKYLKDFSASEKYPGITALLLDQPNNSPRTSLQVAKKLFYFGCKDSAEKAGQAIGPMQEVSFGALPGIFIISQVKVGDAKFNSLSTVGFSKDHTYSVLLFAPESIKDLSTESLAYKSYFSQFVIDDITPAVEHTDAYLMGYRIGILTMFLIVAVLVIAAIKRLVKGH